MPYVEKNGQESEMKLKDLLYEALGDQGLTWPQIQAKFPDTPKISVYQALSSLKAEGRAYSEAIPRPVKRKRGSDMAHGPRKKWVKT